jgi:hypothetical protein
MRSRIRKKYAQVMVSARRLAEDDPIFLLLIHPTLL